MSERILIVDSDSNLRENLRNYLKLKHLILL